MLRRIQELALEFTAPHEGGFVNHPDDPGGATNFGISLRFLRTEEPIRGDLDQDGDVDADDIRALTPELAGEFFVDNFWNDRFDGLPEPVAIRVFDHAVNAGPAAAVRILQRACRSCGRPTTDDGVMGPKTLASAQLSDPGALLTAYRSERAGFYRVLVEANDAFDAFEDGWLNRAYS